MNDPCFDELVALRAKYGTSPFDHAIKKLNRQRLDAGQQREKRQHFSPRMYQLLFDKQKGICLRCDKVLDVPAKRNEIDHINPNRVGDFNSFANLQLLHSSCNRSKGANSIHEESKATGKGYVEILGDEV